MKKTIPLVLALALLLCGCQTQAQTTQIAATTLPVYEFTSLLCQDTPLEVGQLITQSVSCLHDYTLNVAQVKTAEAAQTIVLSGAGLEEFMEDILDGADPIDASQGIELICPDEAHDHHDHEAHSASDDHDDHGHHHEQDPHIWLSPKHAMTMAENICAGLCKLYPQYSDTFQNNLDSLLARLEALQAYGEATLKNLACRELITFHDGFSYFAQAFDLEILAAVEEESGSEASAKDLIELIRLVEAHALPAVFIETNGSSSAAQIIAAETGAKVYPLDMAMAADSYFTAMYHNIDTIQEAMG